MKPTQKVKSKRQNKYSSVGNGFNLVLHKKPMHEPVAGPVNMYLYEVKESIEAQCSNSIFFLSSLPSLLLFSIILRNKKVK